MDQNTRFIYPLIFIVLVMVNTAIAQETVFNVPTTDVLDLNKAYFELDVTAKPVEPEFSSFVPRFMYGAGHKIEIGVNLPGNIQPGPDALTIVPAIKWKFYDGKKNGWAVVLGDNVYFPVQNKTYDAGTFVYAMAQKTFSTKTRIGFGANYFSKDVVKPDEDVVGAQLTLEQPVTERFVLCADWFSGDHASGYLTAGGYYKFTEKFTGYAGYSIGNTNISQGNHFFYFEAGYNFN